MSGASGPLLILMPGLDGTGRLFEPLVSVLPPSLTVRIVRYPTDGPINLAEHADLARQVIGRERVILLAESFSGLVALQLLREGGLEVEKAVFVAGFASPPRALLRAMAGLLPPLAHATRFVPDSVWRHFCLGPGASRGEIAWVRGVIASVAPSVIAQRLKTVASTRFRFPTPIRTPAFYIEGRDDRLVPAHAGQSMATLFESFTNMTLDGPHFLLQTRPQECARMLVEICGTKYTGQGPTATG